MRSFRFFLCALLLAGLARAFSPTYAQRAVWARQMPGNFTNRSLPGAQMATDALGNTYVLGRSSASCASGASR